MLHRSFKLPSLPLMIGRYSSAFTLKIPCHDVTTPNLAARPCLGPNHVTSWHGIFNLESQKSILHIKPWKFETLTLTHPLYYESSVLVIRGEGGRTGLMVHHKPRNLDSHSANKTPARPTSAVSVVFDFLAEFQPSLSPQNCSLSTQHNTRS